MTAPDAIIGDAMFIKEIEESMDADQDDEWLDEDLLKGLSKQLKVNAELLLKPRGLKRRRLRHKAFAILA